jgi:hypothetical protein
MPHRTQTRAGHVCRRVPTEVVVIETFDRWSTPDTSVMLEVRITGRENVWCFWH